MSYLVRRVLAKPRLILDEMCRLYGKFASYLRPVLCKTRLIFPRVNGPIVFTQIVNGNVLRHPGVPGPPIPRLLVIFCLFPSHRPNIRKRIRR